MFPQAEQIVIHLFIWSVFSEAEAFPIWSMVKHGYHRFHELVNLD
jgi:hypothetical protein